MLWPLSGDAYNKRNLFHRWMIYYHAPTFVIRWWQLTEHVSYLRDKSPCSDRCHETMANYGAWFTPLGMYNHALYVVIRQRQDDEANMIYYHALTVVIRWCQLKEHDSYQRDILPCSDRCHGNISLMYKIWSVICHRLMTRVRAWLFIPNSGVTMAK